MNTPAEQVLTVLRQNARLSAEQIAERLNLAPAEVESIIAEAEAAQTIRGYYALVKDKGFHHPRVRALIEVNIQPEREFGFDKIAKSISCFTEVTDVILVSGGYDLLLTVEGENLQEVADFVAGKLATLHGVRSTRTMFMLRKYKEAGFQLEENELYERLKVTP